MKKQIVLLALMCTTLSLTQPAWSMEEKDLTTCSNSRSVVMSKEVETHEAKLSRLKKAALAGDIKSQWKFAKLHLPGWKDCIFERMWHDALPWLVFAAENGHAKSQYVLGKFYYIVHEDLTRAKKWLSLAHAQGHVDAPLLLGSCNERIDKSMRDQYISLYALASEKGSKLARYELGRVYMESIISDEGKSGVINNERLSEWKKVVNLFGLAALDGIIMAQCELGLCYSSGNRGVPQDCAKGRQWLKLAAAEGYAAAQDALESIDN